MANHHRVPMTYIKITRNGQDIWLRNIFHNADGIFVGKVDSYGDEEYPFGSLVTFVEDEISDAAVSDRDHMTVH